MLFFLAGKYGPDTASGSAAEARAGGRRRPRPLLAGMRDCIRWTSPLIGGLILGFVMMGGALFYMGSPAKATSIWRASSIRRPS